ncbi:MAG: argininosuccinate lyase [Candidatus Adiutrix intracellularis]|nr:MAG: argininosuccinate lyase [Candidatus Adiutrix intracellularis]
MTAKTVIKKDKLWGGRFFGSTDYLLERLSTSVNFDYRLALFDIEGSQAHARMLGEVGLLTCDESCKIVLGLEKLKKKIQTGNFNWDPGAEDVHMNLELALTELIGPTGKKLHTARSRNDQVALDTCLYLRATVEQVGVDLLGLREALLDKAAAVKDAPMPGYTHLQHAQPILLAHHLLAYAQMLSRDQERLNNLGQRLDYMPLGSGALSGTGLPIDPERVARDLGFSRLSENSLDAVAGRDHLLEFLAFGAILMTHLSRLAEDLILWCSQEFAFAELPDELSTGSSMMPQKKNPDGAELMRGKAGRVIGNLVTLLTVVKGLPLSYNRDLQEDKEPLFDTADTLRLILPVATKMIAGLKFNFERLRLAADGPYTPATDLADHLVRRGVPFREAHNQAGVAVAYALKKNKALAELTLDELKRCCPKVEKSIFDEMTLPAMLAARSTFGGTAPSSVARQLKTARLKLIWEIQEIKKGIGRYVPSHPES